MKIVLTGAAGFIGSNIAEKLVADGNELVAIDNMHTGSEENLQKVKSKIKFHVSDAGKFFDGFADKCDIICHQGVYSSTPMYMKDHRLTSKIIDEFVAILEYMRRRDVKKLVYASTSSIYNGHAPPHVESMAPHIKDFYTEGRYAMERIGELYHKLYGLDVVGLRYFSVYGPHEKSKKNYANLISQFMWSLLKGEPPVIYGDGSQTRDFTYVDDVVNANVLAMKKGVSGIFNVGTGRTITINEMLSIVNKKLGKDIPAQYVHNPIKNYVQLTQAYTAAAKEKLGFEAKISLEEGIERLVSYYK